MNFENPIRLKDKFEIMTLEESVSISSVTATVSQSNVESSTEIKPSSYKSENKVPSKGLKLTKKKQEEENY